MLVFIFAFLGLCAGSLASALAWRIHAKKDWIAGRSQCPNCNHQLAPKDLLPLASWLYLRGRCRYCGQPISKTYPGVELIGAAVFGRSYYLWPTSLHGAGQTELLATWLIASVGLLALAIYDWRWMVLPSKILYPTAAIVAAGRLVYVLGFAPAKSHALLDWALGVLVASGIFWLLFNVSGGKWIGYGDVRLGLVSGSVLASPSKSLLMIFLASTLGTIFVLPSLGLGHQKITARVPYGPFLIIATFITLLAGTPIINWYKSLLS